MATTKSPVIPQYITVHLGPPDSPAENYTLPFIDYIKNVASSEIYPTWPENAIRANIYAQISYALNRIYTEHYRSLGYDFDITNSTRFDQAFVKGRDIFENISKIVDQIFNDYVIKQGSVEPYFTQYCNGTTVTCNGLSQWGTVTQANLGKNPYEILQFYYGDDIDIIKNAPVENIVESYPGFPLKLGSAGNEVAEIQKELKRIRNNYPQIPRITDTEGIFGVTTDAAVKEFQKIFYLTQDGIVGKSTWYKIKNIYNGVKQLSELTSEGIKIEDIEFTLPEVLKLGDSGITVLTLQYYLAVIGYFNPDLPLVELTGVYDQQTYDAVVAFQKYFGLSPDGIVGRETWKEILLAYKETLEALPANYEGQTAAIYPGEILSAGFSGESVRKLQKYLNIIGIQDPQIPAPSITGLFGDQTLAAVKAFQTKYKLPVTGLVGAVTWNKIAQVYNNIILNQ